MKRTFLFCGVLFCSILFTQSSLMGQNKTESYNKLDSIVVEAYRASKKAPVTHSTYSKEELTQSSPTHSIPLLLSNLPSIVASTEGGNGLGYSSIRVRGSDATRINVTLNGIALNDGESHQLFWVNIPSLQTMLQDVQVVRGVGTSNNGPASFGASINMRTLYTSPEPYLFAQAGAGSFNTFLSTVGFGTGRDKRGLSFDFRFSRNSGLGYIRNAKTDLKSLFASLGWYTGESSFKLNYILGDQTSGITWEGISKEQEKLERRFNPAGLYYDEANNKRYYDNETDNYQQHHLQLHFSSLLSSLFTLNSTLHYTRGGGYYENYKYNKKFKSYGLEPQSIEGMGVVSKSDFITRQAVYSDFLALNNTISYNKNNFNMTAGLTASYYDGIHYGNVIWSKFNQNIPQNHRWYTNDGYKWDSSTFIRGEYNLSPSLLLFADIQYRYISYIIRGIDKDFASMDWGRSYNFFNPKFGVTYSLSSKTQLYGSIAKGMKEPSRSDIKESIKAGRADAISPEKVIDYEFGARYKSSKFAFESNLFFMEYKDQLIPTGKKSETGYVIKENVKDSYRRGLEVTLRWDPISFVAIEGNSSISTNKILNYSQFFELFDSNWNPLGQKEQFFKKSDISFSPSLVSMLSCSLYPTPKSSIVLKGKYVGDQYMDNSGHSNALIPSYFTTSLMLSKTINLKNGASMQLDLFVENLLNERYFSDGWIYKALFNDGSWYVEEGIYPQPFRNYTLKLSFNL